MDLTTNYSVPFYITGINNGFQEAQGLVKLRQEGLELEFEVQDSFIGIFKSGITTMTIPFSDLVDIRLKKGWFSSRIILEATSMKVFEKLPGANPAESELKVKRKNKQEAERLVSQARMQLSEYKLDQFE